MIFILTEQDSGAEKEAELQIEETATPQQLKKQLFAAFPVLKDETNYYIKGFTEGSKEGVFKPIDRVKWQFVAENTKFYLDVVVGNEASELKQQRIKRDASKREKELAKHQVVRQRWAEGYRKCARCQQMYLVQQNGDESCTFVEVGFSPGKEGVYKRAKLGPHLQAKAKLEEYNDIVRDIRTVGHFVTRGIGLGTEGVGLVEHAKEGGSIGAAGENVSGWTPEDFEAINNPVGQGDSEVENQNWCQIM